METMIKLLNLRKRKSPNNLIQFDFFKPQNFSEMKHIVQIVLLSLSHIILVRGGELEQFQKLFMQKRIEQLGAVKNIIKLDEIKRKNLLNQITSKLFQVFDMFNVCKLTMMMCRFYPPGEVILINLDSLLEKQNLVQVFSILTSDWLIQY